MRLPPIVPMVLYHGAAAWTVPTAFSALVPAPQALRPHLPDFAYLLTDLGRIEDAGLSADRRLRAGLMALKYIFCQEMAERLGPMLLAQAVDFVVEVLTYVGDAHPFLDEAAVREALRQVLPEQEEAIMATLAQQWEQRGVDKGLAAGRAEGRAAGEAEGKAKALLRVLTRRFGALPDAARAAVMAADSATLDGWIDLAIDAPSLEAVLGARHAN